MTKRGRPPIHGMSRTKLYKVYTSMKMRCTNPKDKKYHLYGGRGVSVSEEWNTFDAFVRDMGIPVEWMTIDRFPNKNGNYEPGNCRWTSVTEQNRNLTSNVLSVVVARRMRELAALGNSVKAVSDLTGTTYMNAYDVLVRGRWAE